MSQTKQLDRGDRELIETMLLEKRSVFEIAAALEVHYSSIYREIRRGSTGSVDYSADAAQTRADAAQTRADAAAKARRETNKDANRRHRLTLPDRKQIAELLSQGLSPEAIAEQIGFSVRAIYSELRRGADESSPTGYSAERGQKAVGARKKRKN